LASQNNQNNLKQSNNHKENTKTHEINNYSHIDYKTNDKYIRNEHNLSNTYGEKNYNNHNLTSWSNTRKHYDSNYNQLNNSELKHNKMDLLNDTSDLADDFMEARDYNKEKRNIYNYDSKKEYITHSDKLKGDLVSNSNKPESNFLILIL
jgi:hypothetical protein